MGSSSSLLVTFAVAAAGIGGVFLVVDACGARGASTPAATAVVPPEGDIPATRLAFEAEPAPATADAGADPEPAPVVHRAPRSLAWLGSLPLAPSFRSQALSSAAGDPLDTRIELRWTMIDQGEARDATGEPLGDGVRDHRYALEVTWRGQTASAVLLERSHGWPDPPATTYCAVRGWTYRPTSLQAERALPELAIFAEGTFRGDEVYRVLATPHAIHVIEQDTSPADWIRTCHEVHQGPFTECREMAWSLAATFVVDLPAEVAVTEQIESTDADGTSELDCGEPDDLYETIPPEDLR